MNPVVADVVRVLVTVGAVMLTAAAALTVVRMARGPSSLDRVVAADVLVAVVIAGLAAEAILHDHATTLPVMLVLSLLGFAGAVSIARLVAERDTVTTGDRSSDRGGHPDRENRPPRGRQ